MPSQWETGVQVPIGSQGKWEELGIWSAGVEWRRHTEEQRANRTVWEQEKAWL